MVTLNELSRNKTRPSLPLRAPPFNAIQGIAVVKFQAPLNRPSLEPQNYLPSEAEAVNLHV